MKPHLRCCVTLCCLAILICYLTSTTAHAATITAERNCAVRVEGDAFTQGQFVGVYKGSTTAAPIARIKILKVDTRDPTRVIGRVLHKPGSTCTHLKGLVVAPLADAYLPAGAKNGGAGHGLLLSSLEFSVDTSYVIVNATSGVNTQSGSEEAAAYKLLGIAASFDVFPLLFGSSSFFAKAFGLGLRYDHLLTLQEIPIETDAGYETAQKATGYSLTAESIFRIPYLSDQMSTEFRVFYLMESFKNALTKKVADLKEPPLRDVAFSGIGVRLLQRWAPSANVRLSLGGHYAFGLSVKSPTSYSGINEEQTSTYSSPSGFGAQSQADFKMKTFKLGIGYRLEGRQAANKLHIKKKETSSVIEKNIDIKLKYLYHEIFMALGLAF